MVARAEMSSEPPRSMDFIRGAKYWAYFSMTVARVAGSSASMSAWNCPLSWYRCHVSASIWRSAPVVRLGVPLARPPRRPRPSFFGLAITKVVFFVVSNNCGRKR